MKKTLHVIVEMADSNLSAYIQEVDGIVATASNIMELRSEIEKGIALYIDTCKEYGYDVPEELTGDYELEFKYDTRTFLCAYEKLVSKAGLERITGINQKQLWHYSSGTSTPSARTKEKMQAAIHAFADDLRTVCFA